MTVQDTLSPTARRKRSAEPEAYDFRRPMTLAREHARALQVAFETFARQWATQMTSRLRVPAQVTLDAVELRSYDEHVAAMPATTVLALCAVEPGRATGILQLPMGTTMRWVDYLLGGPGLPSQPDRELTEIEWQLVKEQLDHALRDLTYAFVSLCPLDVTARSVQYNPQFVQAAAAGTPMLVARFDMVLAEQESTATFAVPAEVLLSALQAGDTADRRSQAEIREHELAVARLGERVHEVPVGVSVRFAARPVTARDVTALQVGTVLPLHHRVDAPLDVVIGDVRMARAALGSNGSRLACLVVTPEEKS